MNNAQAALMAAASRGGSPEHTLADAATYRKWLDDQETAERVAKTRPVVRPKIDEE